MGNHRRTSVHIPTELITDILSRLPVKSLVRFKCVSKSWRNIINRQDFIELHKNQLSKSNSSGAVIVLGHSSLHTFNFHDPQLRAAELHYPVPEDPLDEYQLVGSCNGLICLKSSYYFALYNPATRAYKKLPDQNSKFEFRRYAAPCYKFAYDCIAEDYKILSLITYYGCSFNEIGKETQLYSMKENSWEIIENPPWDFHDSHSRSVTAKNSLHWIDRKFTGSPILIRSFDLFTRKYDEIELPNEINPNYSRLAVFRGELHLVTDDFDIWMLKNDGIMEKIWSPLKNNDFDPEYLPSSFHVMLCPTPIFRVEEIQVTSFKKEVEKIVCFDLESKEKFEVEIEGLPNELRGFNAEAWAESLEPLD